MGFDLNDVNLQTRATQQLWALHPEQFWGQLSDATREEPAPLVTLHLDALAANANDLARRAGGLPIRLASKSLRSRDVLKAVLAQHAFRGVLAYSLAEAVWLAEDIDDVLVAYPSVNRVAIRELLDNEHAAQRVTVMVDSVEHLDLIDAVLPSAKRPTVRVCLDFDASWHAPLLGNVGVYRSPVHEPEQLQRLAETVLRRPGFTLVGVMSYEAQIAGVQNAPQGNPLKGVMMRRLQRFSGHELRERRQEALARVTRLHELEFVNGGGTGSIEHTASEPWITEVAAGSGLYGPHIFDHYQHFHPAPAVAYAVDVVRKATLDTATVFGGGWVASGVSGPDRSPTPVWPPGLSFAPREGAGEVQTPLTGAAAAGLRPGDRVWMRHAKSGEVMEHAEVIHCITGHDVVARLPTYRGEGKTFS